jgi:hypothetical protein
MNNYLNNEDKIDLIEKRIKDIESIIDVCIQQISLLDLNKDLDKETAEGYNAWINEQNLKINALKIEKQSLT